MKTIDIISFHPGRQHNFEQAYQISSKHKSFRHLTSLYISKQMSENLGKFSKKAGNALKRRAADVASRFVDTNPIPELRLLLKRELGQHLNGVHYQARNELFQKWILRKYAPPQVCIGYDTSSWVVFEKWKGKSFLILDLSIAIPQHKLRLAKEYGLKEDFIQNITIGDAITRKYYEKELALADLILCGSEFVKSSCIAEGIAENKLVVIPYGTDLSRFKTGNETSDKNQLVKIVFVGAFGYRKGADVLLQAWEQIRKAYPEVELHIFGGVQIPEPENKERIFFHGFVNQDQLIEEMKSAHISVLPTFFEGSSLAVYQSMAMRLAVVTTENAGSIIEHGKNGFIVPYGSVLELKQSLQMLLDDPGLRKKIALQAQQDVQEYTWDNYGNKLNVLLEQVMSGSFSGRPLVQQELLSNDHQ
jgi:glycosyltransferase involved in cell wall biosynthesis